MTAERDRSLARIDLDRLADDLAEIVRRDPSEVAERLEGIPIRLQAEVSLRLPPQERLEVLLHAPQPMRLVRALPEIDAYLTVREVGPVAGLPLVSLLSAPQVLHIVDLESWRRDRFDAERAGAWAAVFLESGDATLRRFLRHAEEETLVLLARDWMRVRPVESENAQGPEVGGAAGSADERGTVSPDGYYRFEPERPEHVAAARRFAEILFELDSHRYFRILSRSLWDLPSELEEEALRWRQSRLEERGFPPWDEAVSVYAPPEGAIREREVPPESERDSAVAPRAPLAALGGFPPLAEAVATLHGESLERVLRGLMSVANRLLVADLADPGDPAAHRAALDKAAGFVSIALSNRAGAEARAAAAALADVPTLELFREGYSRVAALQRRARSMVESGWASDHAVALELLDAPLRPRVRGLLLPRPLFYDPSCRDAEDRPYREFRSSSEIEETRVSLEMSEVLGEVFVERLGLDPPVLVRGTGDGALEPPRFSTAFLTALAWHATRGSTGQGPVPREVFREFLRGFAARRTAPRGAVLGAAEALVRHLVELAGLDEGEARSLRAFGTACLDRLEQECGDLDPDAEVDPRFVSCIRLEH